MKRRMNKIQKDISKITDKLDKLLSDGNEQGAKVQAEALINAENQIPAFEIVISYCDHITSSLSEIENIETHSIDTTVLATMIHACTKIDVD